MIGLCCRSVQLPRPRSHAPPSHAAHTTSFFRVQKAVARLGTWLQHSTGSVRVIELQRLLARLEQQEPQSYRDTEALLQTGAMPQLVFSSDIGAVNPALLYCMHASHSACREHRVFLPSPNCDLQTLPDHELRDMTLTPSCAQEVGEVWWLFDAEGPYLAEVFQHGQVPQVKTCQMAHGWLAMCQAVAAQDSMMQSITQ